MKLPETKEWKLFFYFPKNNNGVLKDKDKAPDCVTRGRLPFSVQSLLVRCGFQSPATQEKLLQNSCPEFILTTCRKNQPRSLSQKNRNPIYTLTIMEKLKFSRSKTYSWKNKCRKIHLLLFMFILAFNHLNAQLSQTGIFSKFSILARDSITTTNTLIAKGKAGGKIFVSSSIGPSDSIITDTNTISSVLNNIENIRADLNSMNGAPITVDTLINANLNNGVYSRSNSLHLAGTFKISNPTSFFLINVIGDLIIDSSFIFLMEGINPSKVVWNVGGKIEIRNKSQVQGIFISQGDIYVQNSFLSRICLFSNGSIKIQSAPNSSIWSYSKLQKILHVPCTNAQAFGELIKDGNFEFTLPDVPPCQAIGGSTSPTTSCALNGVNYWTCCLGPGLKYTGPTILSHNQFAQDIDFAPNSHGATLNDPNPGCNYFAFLQTSVNQMNGFFTRATLVQPLSRTYRKGKFRISFSYRIGGNERNCVPTLPTTNLQFFAGLGNTTRTCFVGTEAAEYFENQEIVNFTVSVDPSKPDDPTLCQWREFCGVIELTDPFEACGYNTFFISVFDPNPTTGPTNYFIMIDNISVRSLQNDAVQIADFCIKPFDLNDPSNVSYGVLPQGGNWFFNGVQIPNNLFVAPSAGSYTLTYSFTLPNPQGGNCTFTLDVTFEVLGHVPVNAGPDLNLCVSNGRITLSGSPVGGTWSGNGVIIENGTWFFDPMLSNVNYTQQGNTLTYSLPTGGSNCAGSDNLNITLFGANGNLEENRQICIGENTRVKFSGIVSDGSIFDWSIIPNQNVSVSPPFNPNDVFPFTSYNLTFAQAGDYEVRLTVTNPNAPQNLQSCATHTYSVLIRVLDLSSLGQCCAKNAFVVEQPNIIANSTLPIGSPFRGEIGNPNELTTFESLDDEDMIFEGEYIIKGPIRLSKTTGNARFIIKEGTILYFDHPSNGYRYGLPGNCLSISENINRNFLLVDEGVTLILKGCTLQATCDQMWQGLIIAQNGALLAKEGGEGSKNLIKDAITGIMGLNNCEAATPYCDVSDLDVSSTDFKNCMIGLGDYNRSYGSKDQEGNLALRISHCSFVSFFNQMLHPFAQDEMPGGEYDRYLGLAGIHLRTQDTDRSGQNININYCNFENLVNGILTQGYDLTLNECEFNYCYRSAIAKTSYTGNSGFTQYSNNFQLNNIKIEVPHFNGNTFPEKGYDPMLITQNAWSISTSSQAYGIKAYATQISLKQDQVVNSNIMVAPPYYIRGAISRPKEKVAYGIWTEPAPFEGVICKNAYFYNLDEGVSIRRSFRPNYTGQYEANWLELNHFHDNRIAIFYSYFNPTNYYQARIPSILTIYQNYFHGNKTAIDLRAHNAPLPGVSDLWTDLNLRCNHFSPGNSNFGGTYTGLKLGNNHRLRFDAVGGDMSFNYDFKGPGANIWPLFGSVNRAILPCGQADVEEPCTLPAQNWTSPPNWVSVANSSGQAIQVWRYLNEFIGSVGSGDIQKLNISNRCYTDLNLLNNFIPGPNDVQECLEGIPDNGFISFPTRPAADTTAMPLTTSAEEALGLKGPRLDQNIPNPGKEVVSISYQLPNGRPNGTIRLHNLADGRTLAEVGLSGKAGTVALSLSNVPAGVYAYSLMANGQPVLTRKLVVIK